MTASLDDLMKVIPTMPVEKLVKLFVKTREAKSQESKVWEAKEAEYKAIMAACENHLLRLADETGAEGFKTPYGTTYTATETQISIADHEAFEAFVKAQDDLGFYQARVSSKRVQEYMDKLGEGATPPPGLNVFRTRVMRVRKA